MQVSGSGRRQPKVRTGCLRCKARRVKCGEEKPACLRCRTRGETCTYRTSRPPSETSDPSIPTQVQATAAFHNELEYQYFQLFSSRTTSALSSIFSRRLWEEKFPFQAINGYWDAPYVRHAAIALAALDKASLSTSTGNPNLVENDIDSYQQHCQFALEQYTSCVKGLRLWLKTEIRDDEVSKALMAILLMIYYEDFHRRFEGVLLHAASALRIIETTLMNNPSRPVRYAPNSPSNIIDEELIILVCFINLQISPTLSISNPKLLQGDSVEQLRRLRSGGLKGTAAVSRYFTLVMLSTLSLKQRSATYPRKLGDSEIATSKELISLDQQHDIQSEVDAQWLDIFKPLFFSTRKQASAKPSDFVIAVWMQLRSQTGLQWPPAVREGKSTSKSVSEMQARDRSLQIIIDLSRGLLTNFDFKRSRFGKPAVVFIERVIVIMEDIIAISGNPVVQGEAREVLDILPTGLMDLELDLNPWEVYKYSLISEVSAPVIGMDAFP